LSIWFQSKKGGISAGYPDSIRSSYGPSGWLQIKKIIFSRKIDDFSYIVVVEHKFKKSLRFRLGGRIKPGSLIVVFKVVEEIPVDLHSSRSVFIDLSISIIVISFSIKKIFTLFSLFGISWPHQPWFFRINNPVPPRRFHSHHGYQAVAVQILRTVFVNQTIIILIHRMPVTSSFLPGPGKISRGSIWVEKRDNVNGSIV